MYSSLSQLSERQAETTARLFKIEDAIRDSTANAVSAHDMRVWIAGLKAQNPTLNVQEWIGR
jgi:hypothetical protein